MLSNDERLLGYPHENQIWKLFSQNESTEFLFFERMCKLRLVVNPNSELYDLGRVTFVHVFSLSDSCDIIRVVFP